MFRVSGLVFRVQGFDCPKDCSVFGVLGFAEGAFADKLNHW